MAKTRCWLVRGKYNWYDVFVGRRPYLSKAGKWVGKWKCMVGSRAVEALLPKKYQLEPGGGPVELET